MQQHELIARIDAHLSGVPVTDVLTIGGIRWHVKVLDRFEEAESKTYIPGDASILQAFSDTSLQQLTLAVQALDLGEGAQSIELCFPLPADFQGDATARRRASRTAFMTWLGHVPGVVTQELYVGYLDLKERGRKMLEGLTSPLSKTAAS